MQGITNMYTKIVRFVLIFALLPVFATAQDIHDHTSAVSGVPQGVPYFCARPTVTSISSGSWSESKTWSTGKVPAGNDKVRISNGHTITFDTATDVRLDCVEVDGILRFATNQNTRMKVANLTVMDQGTLEVGTTDDPVLPNVTAEIIIADQPIDRAIDPAQIGTGIESLGRITMHGSVKSPTFARLSREPIAGDMNLVFDQPLTGWMPGDHIVIPDTRQLRDNERGGNYEPQDEELQVTAVAGNQITLATPRAPRSPGSAQCGWQA